MIHVHVHVCKSIIFAHCFSCSKAEVTDKDKAADEQQNSSAPRYKFPRVHVYGHWETIACRVLITYTCTGVCICLPLPSTQSFYGLIASYEMDGADCEVAK